MQSTATCPECNGEGKTITHKCQYCNGEGIVRQEEVVSFSIPAGVTDGMTLSLKGKGNAARNGGINGDLLVVIEEEPHPDLIRDGNDLIYNLMLDIPTAALGGAVEIPTITGRARVKIPAEHSRKGVATTRQGTSFDRRLRHRRPACQHNGIYT